MDSTKLWQRLEFAGQAVYVYPDKPDWFVPNRKADELLQRLMKSASRNDETRPAEIGAADFFELARLHSLTSAEPAPVYAGRAAYLSLDGLQECWFHLTDACNLACRHCLFGAAPHKSRMLPAALLADGLNQALQLGCRLFYFTGGEPFIYPDVLKIVSELLADNPDVHVVVLTNGLLLAANIKILQTLPRQRFHLQVSLDGLESSHDKSRGPGAYQRLLGNLAVLRQAAISATLAVAVSQANVAQLPAIITLAADQGLHNVHLLWYFVRGNGQAEQFAPAGQILPQLLKAQEAAEKAGVLIDNVEAIRAQVFSTPGTRHDLSNTAWQSLAIGPDGNIYPSPALIDIAELNCGPLAAGLAAVWQQSPVLEKIRGHSLLDTAAYREQPLKFLIGGGDLDHSYLAGGAFVGHDPYLELYNSLALWLITRQAARYPDQAAADIKLRMGDVRYDCPADNGQVALTHCNCVISLADDKVHRAVREFYGRAAVQANEEIVNPFATGQQEADYIPSASKVRSYGCGSPVKDAEPRPGEVLIDLGSGSGVECFMAAAAVGPQGRVYGIDMTDEMLELARTSQQEVAKNLGYDNVVFKKGLLEDIPLAERTADAVISNCVINLSPDKRRTFLEIHRILKPGGRMVIADIVTDRPIPVAIKNNRRFRDECLGGAMQQEELVAMLRSAGFTGLRLLKRFPYRREGGLIFYSLTYSVSKPAARPAANMVEVIYRGPFGAVFTEDGLLLLKGKKTAIPAATAGLLDESVFVLDKAGTVSNMPMANTCGCGPPAASEILPLKAISPGPTAGGCCGPAQTAPPPAAIAVLSPAALKKGQGS